MPDDRSNIPVTTAEEYYEVFLYNEFLSHVRVELQERFCDTQVQGILDYCQPSAAVLILRTHCHKILLKQSLFMNQAGRCSAGL